MRISIIGEEDSIIPKTTYSAFHKTNLEERLRERNIADLVIGGVMTNLCCETTARSAFVRDFHVFFLADGTSTISEEFHLATLKNLAASSSHPSVIYNISHRKNLSLPVTPFHLYG